MKPDYAVIVTTPQQVSVIDAERAVNMAKELKIPFIGIVENMSTLLCPHCQRRDRSFWKRRRSRHLAKEMNVQFLGSIPIRYRRSVPSVIPADRFVLEKPNC